MLIFRITLKKYSDSLYASGSAARWNNNDVKMIYTANSRALACLENIVHRSKLGLSANFCVMEIDVPNSLSVEVFSLEKLSKNWDQFEHTHLTQALGDEWIDKGNTAILKVPSSIVHDEFNYLLNPNHPDFKKIKLVAVKPFFFDDRIKN